MKLIIILLLIPSITFANPTKEAVILIETKESQGSGVIISPNGLIITAAHVIGDKRTVRVYRGNKPYIAPVAYIDNKSDIALLKIDAEDLPYAKIAYEYKKSDTVYTISNPKGCRNIYNEGKIISLNLDQGLLYTTTNNIIDSGSSGGGVFNEDGELVSTIHAVLKSGNALSIPIGNFRLMIEHYIDNLS